MNSTEPTEFKMAFQRKKTTVEANLCNDFRTVKSSTGL